MISNPFTTRAMITDTTKFFGRKDEQHHIYNRLKSLQCVSVVGERRMGKSSLLYHVANSGQIELDNDSYLIYIDLQDVENRVSIGHLFHNVLKKIDIEFSFSENIIKNLSEFSANIKKLKNDGKNGKNIIVILDEFEEVIQHREIFPEDFFDQMRALINNGSLGMITSSRFSLRTLCLDGNLSSPFYNVFSKIELSDFKDEEADDFINGNWGIDPFSSDEVSFILSYPQYRHPLILQIICYWVIENRTMLLNEKELEKRIAKDAENFFDKGFFNAARRHKGELLKGGKKIWELAEAIIKKRLGG